MLETIVAQATPPGRGGIGILRISGPQAANVALIVVGRCPQARYAEYRRFYDSDGSVLDQGIVLFFPQPHSFTGEDVLELQGHGGQILLDLLLHRILQIPGLRIAKPGEFSERAFLNNKLDLTQAEATADLIAASSAQSARCAMRSLQGVFSKKIQQLVSAITQLRIYVESALDFPDEEIDWYSEEKITADLAAIMAAVTGIQIQANQGQIMRDGIKVVIAGRPNAGKSTLMNSLTGCQTAIVTAIAGTTRDLLRESVHLDGIPLQLVDTAGLREASDEIERLGIDRAWSEIAQADHLLLVIDSTSKIEDEHPFAWPTLRQHFPDNLAVTIIRNKIDLTQEVVGLDETHTYPLLRLSAATGEGMELLRHHLKVAVGWQKNLEGEFLARRRHLTALKQSAVHLQQAQTQLSSVTGTIGGELLAESLRLAQQSLDEITGRFTADDLLGEIFSHFCIGK